MSKSKIIIFTLAAWLIGCAYSAYYYVNDVLSSPGIGPGYEQDWQFQLLMFSLVRLPFWLVGLLVVVSLEIFMLKPSPGKLK